MSVLLKNSFIALRSDSDLDTSSTFLLLVVRVIFLLVNRLHNKILLARKQVNSMRFGKKNWFITT